MTKNDLDPHTISKSAIDCFVDYVRLHIKNTGATLNFRLLQKLAGDYEATMNPDEHVTEAIFRQSNAHRSIRKAFDRTLIHRFAHLFPEQSAEENTEPLLSRRALIGFHIALDRMIGSDNLEKSRQKAREIIEQELQTKDASDLNWDDIYENEKSNELCDDILIKIVPHFDNFEQRKKWLSRVIENNLSAPDRASEDTHWEFGDKEFTLMMRSLYEEILEKLDSDEGKNRIEEKYGKDMLAQLESFLDKVYSTSLKH